MRRIEAAGAVVVLSAVSLALAIALAALPDSAARLPPSLQRQLQAREAALQAMAPSQRQALQQRVADWDALPLAERRRRREYWQAWQALPPGERWQVRTAARQFAGLRADQQQALRARFAEVGGSDRRGWLLGPG